MVTVQTEGEHYRVTLQGECVAEDAETFLNVLRLHRGADVDLRECTAMHTAIVQVILAAKPRLLAPADAHLASALQGADWETAA